MSKTQASTENYDETGHYEIRIKGYLDDRWADRFAGLTITREANGDTLLTGPVVDQSALYGLLRKVRDLGLSLVAVARVDPKRVLPPDDNPGADHIGSNEETNT